MYLLGPKKLNICLRVDLLSSISLYQIITSDFFIQRLKVNYTNILLVFEIIDNFIISFFLTFPSTFLRKKIGYDIFQTIKKRLCNIFKQLRLVRKLKKERYQTEFDKN